MLSVSRCKLSRKGRAIMVKAFGADVDPDNGYERRQLLLLECMHILRVPHDMRDLIKIGDQYCYACILAWQRDLYDPTNL